jgi:hypothetical protein
VDNILIVRILPRMGHSRAVILQDSLEFVQFHEKGEKAISSTIKTNKLARKRTGHVLSKFLLQGLSNNIQILSAK